MINTFTILKYAPLNTIQSIDRMLSDLKNDSSFYSKEIEKNILNNISIGVLKRYFLDSYIRQASELVTSKPKKSDGEQNPIKVEKTSEQDFSKGTTNRGKNSEEVSQTSTIPEWISNKTKSEGEKITNDEKSAEKSHRKRTPVRNVGYVGIHTHTPISKSEYRDSLPYTTLDGVYINDNLVEKTNVDKNITSRHDLYILMGEKREERIVKDIADLMGISISEVISFEKGDFDPSPEFVSKYLYVARLGIKVTQKQSMYLIESEGDCIVFIKDGEKKREDYSFVDKIFSLIELNTCNVELYKKSYYRAPNRALLSGDVSQHLTHSSLNNVQDCSNKKGNQLLPQEVTSKKADENETTIDNDTYDRDNSMIKTFKITMKAFCKENENNPIIADLDTDILNMLFDGIGPIKTLIKVLSSTNSIIIADFHIYVPFIDELYFDGMPFSEIHSNCTLMGFLNHLCQFKSFSIYSRFGSNISKADEALKKNGGTTTSKAPNKTKIVANKECVVTHIVNNEPEQQDEAMSPYNYNGKRALKPRRNMWNNLYEADTYNENKKKNPYDYDYSSHDLEDDRNSDDYLD